MTEGSIDSKLDTSIISKSNKKHLKKNKKKEKTTVGHKHESHHDSKTNLVI